MATGTGASAARPGAEPTVRAPSSSLRECIDADRLARLGSLTAAAVHGLRNPLVTVKSFLQLLSERYDDMEFRERFRRLAARELGRVEELLDDLAGLARNRGAASAELAPAVSAAGRLLGHYARAEAGELEVEPPPSAIRVALSPTDLQHLLVALGMHGLAWGGAGSRLRIEVAEPGHGPAADGPTCAPRHSGAIEIRLRCLPGDEREGRGPRPASGPLPLVVELLATRGGGAVRAEPSEGGELELRIRLPASG